MYTGRDVKERPFSFKRYIMPGLISIVATGFMARFFSGRPTDFSSNVYEDTTTFEKL
jgi:hypothetical protein